MAPGTPGHRQTIPPSGRTILVVDDQLETLGSVRMLLEREGHRVLTAESGSRALALLASEPVHLILVDYFMPVMNGELLIRAIRERNPHIQIILQTGYAGEKPPREMLRRLAIQGYHDKTDDPDRLLLWVDVALKAHDQVTQLHAAERLKAELLANVSHDFRTPLNVILGSLDLLRDGPLGACPPAAVSVFESVASNAGGLLDLVEELLEVAPPEAGGTHVTAERVALTPFLRELVESFAVVTSTKPLVFRADVPDDLPVVTADAAKLRVVVQTLLSNALESAGGDEIALAAEPRGARVAIQVRDTGPGIAAEHLEEIFDLGQRRELDGDGIRGAGLALALARRFARMMGGEATVESEVGRGAVFTVVLPVAEGDAAVPAFEKGAA